LQLVHWQSDALTTMLDLIRYYARSHPHYARSHPHVKMCNVVMSFLARLRGL